jgi:glycosyltransferase involved in cell wall biosynthesis
MSRPLRVVIEGAPLADGRGTAGIGRYLRSLVQALRQRDDVEVHLAVPRRPSPTERHELRYLYGQPGLAATALRRRPDLVHAVANEPAAWPPRSQVVTLHDVIAWTSAAHARRAVGAAYFRAQARRLRHCAGIIVPSRVVAERAVEALRLEPGRVSVVPEGVDAVFTAEPRPDDEQRRTQHGLAQRSDVKPYILWTGSLLAPDPRKALDTLIEAMHGVDALLVLAGRTGAEADRLRALAQIRDVDLRTTGWVCDEDLAALQRGAAASVIPSLDEGFGLPALEAMACGTPLVATSAGNLPDLTGGAALLVPPADRQALHQALAAILDNATAARYRAAGPIRARDFTWASAAEGTVNAYRQAQRRC